MSRTLFTSRQGGDLKLSHQREILRASLSLPVLHFMKQSHSDTVLVVDGTGADFECDGLITNIKGVGLAALAADCMPITFSAAQWVGVAHVGRVGFIKGIAQKTVEMMRELGAGEIKATIGPSICGDCYEVSPQMYQEISEHFPAARTSNSRHALDLQRGVTFELEEMGVVVQNLNVCTREDPNYFSFRRGAETERQAGLISL